MADLSPDAPEEEIFSPALSRAPSPAHEDEENSARAPNPNVPIDPAGLASACQLFSPTVGSVLNGTVDPDTIPKPTPATMGEYHWDGQSHWYIRMGETPNFTWTKALPAKVSTPFQSRGPKHDTAKATTYRRGKSLSLKINLKTSIPIIQEAIIAHLLDHGMRTIAFLPDPRTPGSMVCGVEHAALFNPQTATTAVAPYLSKWDQYDLANNNDGIHLLEHLCDLSLWRDIKKRTEDPFIVLYARIIWVLQPKSKEYYDALSERLKLLKVSSFPGQHVPTYTKHALELHEELSYAGYSKLEDTKHLLTALAAAGGINFTDTNQRWKGTFFQKLRTYDMVELAARHLDKDSSKLRLLEDKDLSFLAICQTADNLYDTEVLGSRWEPAVSTVDKSKVPRSFQANLLHPVGSSNPSTMSNNSTLPGNCHICGKPGHWARSCPSKPTNNPRSSSNRNPGRSSQPRPRGGQPPNRGSLRPNGNTNRPTSGHPTRPSSGGGNLSRTNNTPTIGWKQTFVGPTTTHNGRSFKWCAKCNRYSTTHDTAGHTKQTTSPQANVAEANVAFTSAAWSVPAVTSSDTSSVSQASDLADPNPAHALGAWTVSLPLHGTPWYELFLQEYGGLILLGFILAFYIDYTAPFLLTTLSSAKPLLAQYLDSVSTQFLAGWSTVSTLAYPTGTSWFGATTKETIREYRQWRRWSCAPNQLVTVG